MSDTLTCSYYISPCGDVFTNQALELNLFERVGDNEVIMLLWSNDSTVVVGKNQDAFAECKVQLLNDDGGKLARRLSGGGAVYHDGGNLNFSFFAKDGAYDVARQQDVIIAALAALGVTAERTGRNDLAVGGSKFSGNAFFSSGGRNLHHGTLLIDADVEKMTKYLTTSAQKLKRHAVNSVASRVINLCSLGVTKPKLIEALIESFGIVYGVSPIECDCKGVDGAALGGYRNEFAREEWRYDGVPFYTKV